MSAEKISRRQAWMKLAVLIADGLPEPLGIEFNRLSETLVSIDFGANEPAFTQWCEAIHAARTAVHVDGGTTLHTAYNWSWHGWSVQMTASSPVAEHEPTAEATEDLTAVRALAESTPDGA